MDRKGWKSAELFLPVSINKADNDETREVIYMFKPRFKFTYDEVRIIVIRFPPDHTALP